MVHEDIEYQIIDKSKFSSPQDQSRGFLDRFLKRFLAPQTCYVCGDTLAIRTVSYPMLGGTRNLKEYRYCKRCRIGYLRKDVIIQPRNNRTAPFLPGL